MPERIDIDDDIFEILKENAEPFVDTPSTVLRRLLGLDTNGSTPTPDPKPAAAGSRERPERSQTKTKAKPKKGKGSRGLRAERGSLLPESEYELPILRYLDSHGGRAPSKEVVEAIGVDLAGRLTEADKQPLNSGDIRWKNRAAFVRLNLIKNEELDGQAPRGTWAITDKGRARLADKR